jgi:hypothetical protein
MNTRQVRQVPRAVARIPETLVAGAGKPCLKGMRERSGVRARSRAVLLRICLKASLILDHATTSGIWGVNATSIGALTVVVVRHRRLIVGVCIDKARVRGAPMDRFTPPQRVYNRAQPA